MQARVTIIVPTWNRRDLVAQLLGNLSSQTYPIAEVLVVDNGSEDGSAELAGKAGARVVALERNSGFSHAVNCGIRESRTEWLAVVNNDVELASDWLAELVSVAVESDVWFATGKVLDAVHRDRIDGTFDLVCRGACAWRAGHGRPDGPEWQQPRSIAFAPFTAALFRAKLFERVGLLDETFESYLEDVEFGFRCALAGCAGAYVPRAVAWHRGSATLGVWHADTVRRIARNQMLLVAKHYPAGWLWHDGWSVIVAQALWGMLALRHGAGWSYAVGKLEGLRAVIGRKRPSSGAGEPLREILRRSEDELLALQRREGFDWLWRAYAALT